MRGTGFSGSRPCADPLCAADPARLSHRASLPGPLQLSCHGRDHDAAGDSGVSERGGRDEPAALYGYISAVFQLFAALLGEIRLNALQSEIEALRREKTALEREEQILSARLAGQMDLEELEQYAEEILGMQRCRADQIVTLPDNG